MNEELNPIAGFPRRALLQRTEKGGKITYWRHLMSDLEYIYVLQVEPGRCPKNSSPVHRWEIKSHLGLFGTIIQQVEEIVCPPAMLNEGVDHAERMAIALRWNMIAWVVSEGGDDLITSPAIRAQYIRLAAEKGKVKEPRIRALLTRHYYFAEHKLALMGQHHLKGAPGVSRFNITKKKMGRPNDNVVINPDTRFKGKNMTPYYKRRWTEVLRDQYALGNKCVSEAYEILVRRLRGFNRDSNGMVVSYAVSPEKLPERSLFLAYGAKIIRELELKAAKLGKVEWRANHAAQRGHSEDLAKGIEIYDFDGMEFNIELLYGGRPVGKPLVMLAVDRRSRAVVGWYAGLGNENGNAYKHCLFNAFTSKEARLVRFNVSHLQGFVYGVCDWAMFDRGPGISLSVTEAVTQRCRVDSIMTSPKDAKGKSVVENVNGIFQNLLSELPGAFKRTALHRDKEKHKNAEKQASLEFGQFMSLLLTAISDFNLHTDVSNLLFDSMLKHGVKPNPKSLFLWHRSSKRGDAAYDWPASAIYKNLLESHKVLAKNGIVTFRKAQYRSNELSLHYERWNSGPTNKRKSPPLTVYSIYETDEILLWAREDGTFAVLEMMDRYRKQYADACGWLHEFVNRLKNSLVREQRADKVKNGNLSSLKEEIIRAADGQSKVVHIKGEKRAHRSDANTAIKNDDHAENMGMMGIVSLKINCDELASAPLTLSSSARKNSDIGETGSSASRVVASEDFEGLDW